MDPIEVLKKRFEAQGCVVELLERISQTLGTDSQIYKNTHKSIKVAIPQEREFKTIFISDNDNLSEIELAGIEKFRFLNGYEGI
ncbi:hypothetical protein V9K67_23980 [Paraflavisolibacter sp. H34]|uniref:hypothetical protein n=1 Tax=Huijunlia imazamoxiresistens TaxID=3127457 RepID=UPI00301A57CB